MRFEAVRVVLSGATGKFPTDPTVRAAVCFHCVGFAELSARGSLPALRFGSGERPERLSLRKGVSRCIMFLMVMISSGCQAMYDGGRGYFECDRMVYSCLVLTVVFGRC